MLTTKQEIKEELQRQLNYLLDNANMGDELAGEIASGFTPVYTNEIIQEWTQLPLSESDKWKELGYDANRNEGGIVQLMAVDLELYYLELGQKAWEELKQEIESEDA